METEKILYENGSIWAISTSGWQGTDRLNADDLGKSADEIPDIFRLGSKYLLPHDERVKLLGARSKITALMNRVGRPFFLKGAWFVPDKNVLVAKEGLEKIRQDQEKRVEDLLSELPKIKAWMMDQYPVLRTAEWPTDEEIRTKFRIRWVVFELTGASGKRTDPDTLLEAKREFQAELKAAYDELKEEILKEAHVAIIETCDDIAKRILETGDKITAATINRPRAIIEQYESVAGLLDMEDVKEKVAELKAVVEKTNAKEIRDNWEVAQNFANKMELLGQNIGDLSGRSRNGQAKRVVRMED